MLDALAPQDAAALRRLIAEAERDARVVGVIAFGSAARGEPHRDVDVAIVLTRAARGAATDAAIEYAGFSSGRKHVGLDVSVFQHLPLYVRHRVLTDARVLWARDEDEVYAVAIETVREWEDFRPHYEMYLEEVARG